MKFKQIKSTETAAIRDSRTSVTGLSTLKTPEEENMATLTLPVETVQTALDRGDTYTRVTNQIIAAIESGVDKWRMPWHTSGTDAFSPVNVASRKAYRGVNVLSLWGASQAKQYDSGTWGTYQQWQAAGGQVRKGEKSTLVVLWRFFDNGKPEGEDEGESTGSKRPPMVRGYSVFNAGQVDGYKAPAVVPVTTVARIEAAERFFSALHPKLRHGGNRAFYSPTVTVPPFSQFSSALGYYGTLAHEMTHWTSHANRCDRKLGKRFGDMAYAAEELIAELGSAFLCSTLGLENQPRQDHAQYVDNWLKVLRADNRAIFTAASQAQKAADWMHDHQQ